MKNRLIFGRSSSRKKTLNICASNGKIINLHSLVDPVEEASEWAVNQVIQDSMAFVVLGFGLGYHIKELGEKISQDSFIFVIDPMLEDAEYRSFFTENESDYCWLREEKKVQIFSKQDVFIVATALNKEMQKRNINQLRLMYYYPAINLCKEAYKPYINQLASETEKLRYADLSFEIFAGKKMIENAWYNLESIFEQSSIVSLSDAFKGKPAIIVSAGPSLNKNIHLLNKIKDNVVIIASGTALGALRKAGIIPHFLVIIDPFDITAEVLKDNLHENIVLVAPYDAPSELISYHRGKICYYKKPLRLSEEHILTGIEEYLPKSDVLLGHISVAVTSFFFAERLGANPIVFVGQDLAFPDAAFKGNGKPDFSLTHASGVKAGEYSPETLRNRKCLVKGFYGGEVATSKEFKLVIDFFASAFGGRKNKCVIINATEGGAYLPNSIHLALEEVIKKYFIKGNMCPSDILKVNIMEKRRSLEEYEKIVGALQQVRMETEKYLEELVTIEKKFKNVLDNVMVPRIQKEEFWHRVSAFLRTLKKDKIYIFLQAHLGVLIDLFELEGKNTKNSNDMSEYSKMILLEVKNILCLFLNLLTENTVKFQAVRNKEDERGELFD